MIKAQFLRSVVCLTLCAIPCSAAIACSSPSGGGPTGSCSVSGSLLGASFAAHDCASSSLMSAGQSVTDIVITDFTGACGLLSSGGLHANSKAIDLHFAGSGALQPGTYNAGSNGLDPQYATYDAKCMSNTGESAGGGTVVVTSVTPSIKGTFDLFFNADHVTGTFDAPICSSGPTDGGTSACM